MATEAKWSDFTSLDVGRMANAANQLLPPWVALLLVITIGWQLASIIWLLIPGQATGDAVVVPAGQVIADRSRPLPLMPKRSPRHTSSAKPALTTRPPSPPTSPKRISRIRCCRTSN